MERTIRINRNDFCLTIMMTIFVTSALWLWFIYAVNISKPSRFSLTIPKTYTSSKNYSFEKESKLKQEILAVQAEAEAEIRRQEEMNEQIRIQNMERRERENVCREILMEYEAGKNVYSKKKKRELIKEYRKLKSAFTFENIFLPDLEDIDNYISLDELNISYDMKLDQSSGISKEDFVELIESKDYIDTSGFFAENAEEIYDLCEEYEINEIFFCGLIAAESGWEITENHRKRNNYISIMTSSGLKTFSSESEGLEEAAKLLHEKYLTEGGDYYHGETIDGVQKSFCSASAEKWKSLVYGCMKLMVC